MIRPLIAVLLCAALAACATAGRQAAQPVQRQVALPPAPPVGEPGGMAGLEETQLRIAFGTPALIRKDGHAEMWRYDGAACKAFFFLYPSGSALAVRHVETLPRGHDIAADAGCLAALRAHSATPVS
ncbi:MAG TPA: hypothetical protein VII49_13525 [Rhizomicrobium sp.]